jgi:hypothetical protein
MSCPTHSRYMFMNKTNLYYQINLREKTTKMKIVFPDYIIVLCISLKLIMN